MLIILIGRPWEQVEIPCQTIAISPYSTQEIAETLSVSDKESVDIFCLSAGITELLSLYNTSISFEENVKTLLHINSLFYCLMNDKMGECFRTPESYNTLLYAMVNGYNRISELAAFSGYPKNKCEKYLGALIDAGLVRKEKEDGKRPDYYLDLSYLHAWYRYVFLSMGRMDKIPERIANYAEKTAVPDKLHKEVVRWMPQRMWILYHTEMLDTRPNCENIMVQGMRFDYVEKTSNETIFAIAKIQFADSDWDAIERAIESVTPFYEAKIILCSIHQFSRFYWKLNRTYENIRLIQLKSMD